MKEEPGKGNDVNAGNGNDQRSLAEEDLPGADQGLQRNMMILIEIKNTFFNKGKMIVPQKSLNLMGMTWLIEEMK